MELAEWINERTVERAYQRALESQEARNNDFALKGWRAAVARDPRLLAALEGASEVLHKIQERQIGRTKRDASKPYSHRVDLTEFSLWRTAFEECDKGQPLRHLEWIYGAAAELAGL